MSKLGDKLGRLKSFGAPAPGAAAPPVPVPVPVPVRVDGLSSEEVSRGGGEEERGRGHGHEEDERRYGPESEQGSEEKLTRIDRLRAQLELLRGKVKPRASGAETWRPVWSAGSDTLPGELHETPTGQLRRVLTHHAEDHQHGSIPVALALDACARDLAVLALDPTLETVDFTRALYIDTETTGLAGGAGTIPFLIGIAWFEGRRLIVEQLLLEKPGHEGPMLARLGELLGQASCIVSYNGKSFDWPLLRTRFILNRIAAPKVPAHLDLLHCARRVYKRRLGAVRLVHLEQAILGFERVDDIAGALIPETYLGFVRGRVPGSALAPIVEHNRSDIVALAAILGELVRRFRDRPAQDARDQLGFAGVAARADDHQRALAFAHSAAEADIRGELAPEAMYLAGELKLRAGDVDGAVEAFVRSVDAACGDVEQAARAHLALAKLYEHKLKAFDRALSHAALAAFLEGDEASARRLQRLTRKGRSTPLLFK